MRELAPGTVFGDWRIERLIGRGGMGVVYMAVDQRLHRPVAIKLIADDRAGDASFRERFEREAQLTAAIDHPNVIPVYAAGEIDGQLYLATRYVDGTDLQELLRTDGPLPNERAAAVVQQVAEALDAAHAAGLVHRDVKPANVLLSGRHVYLSDFGLTRPVASEAGLTDTDERLGTVDFMSPEQLRGQRADARSDVYALGCLLYTVLAGTPPFHGASAAATITAHLESPPPRVARADVPDEFDAVLARALDKDPARRYPSAGDLGRAAIAAAQGRSDRDAGHSVARGEAAPPAATTRLPADADATPRFGAADADGTPRFGGADADATTRLAQPDAGALLADPPTARVVPLKDKRRRHVLVELTVIASFFLVAGVVLIVALTSGGSDPNRPLSSSDVARAARGFASAYSHEDARAMARVLAPDVRRVSPSDVQRGRSAVVAAYRSQFRAQITRGYALENLRVEAGSVGRAEATFRVTRSRRPPITGTVVFGIERRGGKPLIRLIATESRSD